MRRAWIVSASIVLVSECFWGLFWGARLIENPAAEATVPIWTFFVQKLVFAIALLMLIKELRRP